MTFDGGLTDTHCHLVSEKLLEKAQELVCRAADNGVNRIINIAYNKETTEKGIELAQKFAAVWTTVGIQPHDASEYSFELAESLGQLVGQNKKIVAIGEIGLDAFYTLSPMPQQEKCFEHFLEIASRVNKPVVVHVRETHQKVLNAIKKAKQTRELTGVIHCFTGTKAEARDFLDLGFFISFSGIVTFKTAAELVEVAKFVPLDRMLIETDSPYLAPVPQRGKTNEPSFLKHTAAFIAAQKQTPLESFAFVTNQNAINLFGL